MSQNKGEGKITPYGVLYENGMQLEPVYVKGVFPTYIDREYLIEVGLEPAPATPADKPPTTLLLPMQERRLERLLERGGYQTAEDTRINTWCS